MSAQQLYDGSSHFSESFGNSASLTFYGTQIFIYYTAFSNKGKAAIYIDGNLISQLDQYSPTVYWQSKWESPLFEKGVHEFTIIHTKGTLIDLDAVEITEQIPQTATPTQTITPTLSPSPSISPTLTVTVTGTITHTPTPTQSQTTTQTATATQTVAPSETFTSSPTVTHTTTFTPTSVTSGQVNNDEIENAVIIELTNNSYIDELTISDASSNPNDPILPCLAAAGYNSVWYSFTPDKAGKVTVSTENSDELDSAVVIWYDIENDLSSQACNDQSNDQVSNLHALIETNLLAGNTYLIEVVSTGENPSGNLTLNILYEPYSPLTQGYFDDTNEKIIYFSGWDAFEDENAYNQTLHSSSTTGSTAGILFQGERINIYFTASPQNGKIDIFIDNIFLATLNQYAPETNSQSLWSSPVLVDSNHLLSIIHSGEGEVTLDSLDIDPEMEFLNPGIYDDAYVNIDYSTHGWQADETQEAFNQTLHSSLNIGSSASLGFTGSQFSVLYSSYLNHGIMDIFIDGILFDSLNQFSETLNYQNKWYSGKLSHDQHVITLKHAQGENIDIDGIFIDSSDPVPPGLYDDTNENIVYSGSWQTYTESGPYNDSLHISDTPGTTASLSFIGTQITLLYSAFPNRGTLDISIDGSWVTTINQYTAESEWQKTWASEILTPGIHTITIKHASGGVVDLDAFQVTGQTDNLLANPDFETGNISPWEGISNEQLETDETHSGDFAVRIYNEQAYQGWIEVIPGATYTYSAWFKWEEFSGDGWGYDRFNINDFNWQDIASIDNLHLLYEPGYWHKIAITFTPETDLFRVNFGVFGPRDNVEMYFDDLALYEKIFNTPPQVNPTADIQSGEVPLIVNFTSNASDIDGGIKNVLWEFGDGSNSTELNPSHTYYQRGSYIVKLTAWDNDETSSSEILAIEVTDSGSPILNFEEPTSGNIFNTSDTEIVLQGSAHQSGSEIISLVWDNISTDEAGVIQFTSAAEINWQTETIGLKPGKNEILLTVTDNSGKISTDKVFINRLISGPEVSNIQVSSTEIPLYEKYQITFDLQTVADNNFYIYDEKSSIRR